jgi:hypothetical protein
MDCTYQYQHTLACRECDCQIREVNRVDKTAGTLLDLVAKTIELTNQMFIPTFVDFDERSLFGSASDLTEPVCSPSSDSSDFTAID